MNVRLIYITTKNKEEAAGLARTLLTEKLVACVNIIDNITSFYWWDGKINEGAETLLIAKTKESLVDELIQKVKSIHSYDCPCVVSVPIDAGNPDFINWISAETK